VNTIEKRRIASHFSNVGDRDVFVSVIQRNGTRDPVRWMQWRFETPFADEHLQVVACQ
jgi:hypothetical protein